jgi:hypothetical protein
MEFQLEQMVLQWARDLLQTRTSHGELVTDKSVQNGSMQTGLNPPTKIMH